MLIEDREAVVVTVPEIVRNQVDAVDRVSLHHLGRHAKRLSQRRRASKARSKLTRRRMRAL